MSIPHPLASQTLASPKLQGVLRDVVAPGDFPALYMFLLNSDLPQGSVSARDHPGRDHTRRAG